MVHEGMLKWYLLDVPKEEPKELVLQIEEPWTWDDIGPIAVMLQIEEPWTWESVDPPPMTRQILEEWSS